MKTQVWRGLAVAVLALGLVVLAMGGPSRHFRSGAAPASTPAPAAAASARPLTVQPMPGSPQFEGIEGLAVGSSGTVYVSDFSSAKHRSKVAAVTPGGSVTTLIDQPAATWDAGFRAVGVDAGGAVYALIGQEIRKVGADGRASTLAGSTGTAAGITTTPTLVDGTATEASLGNVLGLAVAPDGDVYITDTGWVRKVTPQGKVTTLATCGTGTTPAVGADCLGWPGAIAVDAGGTIYVGSDDYAIRRITPQGEVTVVAHGDTSSGTGLFHRLHGLAVDPTDATVLAADSLGLHKISPDGTVKLVLDDTRLFNIAAAPDGTMYAFKSENVLLTIKTT